MRHRLIGSVLVCLFSASIFAARYSANSPSLRVNESATKFSLKKEGAVVSLAIENSSSSALTARIKLELIDPRDAVRATAMIEASVPSGSNVSTVPMVKIGAGDYDVRELLWHRLRYEIAAIDSSGKETDQVSGLISLSEITPDIFRLIVLAPQEAGKEAKYAVRARTLHPLTGEPVPGVNLGARIVYKEDDKERDLKSSGVTNSIGEALLEFKLPGPLKADDVEINVVARREGFLQEAREEVSPIHSNQILVSTDKPLYQPGQTLRVRILALDRDRKAWANVDGKLKIDDMESTTHFRADFKTSRFGVANVDWKVPDDARLGDYNIEAHIGAESPRRAWGSSWIKISRYELPNFIVNVKPDRGYYLSGQNAEVEVRADYLFGQQVKRGRVRVVRETERRWNYSEQKWETEEGEAYEGALDDDGRFVARIDLAEEHDDFKPGSYPRFRDLRYAAYLTDTTTGRTEQRRFDLRVTKDPIHVYLIERGRASEGLPLQFYISTFYADGSPAQCEVTINRTFDDEDGDVSKAGNGNVERRLATVKTNRYGVAKVASLDAGRAEENQALRLKLTARDDQGGSGRNVHEYWTRSSPATRVETDKTLYRAGEPIKVRLTSNSSRASWVIDLMCGSRLLATRAVQLKEGRAEITFPFNQEFGDELMIDAYPAFCDDNESYNSGSTARVLYPRDRELKLDLKFDQASYRPGDEARADLRVLTPQGRSVESALGVVVFDKAIEERARTDQEFRGRGFGFYDCFRDLLGAGGSLSGVTRRDLDRALTAHFRKTKSLPQDDGELREVLKRSGVDFDELRDGWGNRYYAAFRTASRYSDRVSQFNQAKYGEQPKPKTEIIPVTQQIARVTVRSLGADGKEGTSDDFDVTNFSQIVAEESAKEAVEKNVSQTKSKIVSFSGEGGAIAGIVTDLNDAIIANATVTAKHVNSESIWTAKTNTNGAYLLRGLAPGIYEVRFEAGGFKIAVVTDVAVYSSRLTEVDATLDVGSVTEAVMVTAERSIVQTQSASFSTITSVGPALPHTVASQQIATPRLREYFPETLLWQPQIETDKRGRAHLKFKLADNITTWKMSVVGSTVDGEIGIAEKEFRAFQPFFAEHDPPKVLTEGDEISLPVVLRNYLDKTQTVNAEVKPESWFELLGAARKRADVKAGDAGQVVFDFRAVASVKDGKQRVTAFGSDASDAVEKPVSVHPDGEEVAQTASEVFGESGSLDVVIPIDSINGSVRAELKIYPDLMAHALEGIEGILRRPYGCAEQTISSTYPNLMILRYLEPQSEKLSAPMRKTAEKARRYAQAGYERLLGYRAESGGFSYWGRGQADLALTVYALRFLNDAGDFIGVDEDVIADARKFILSSQQPDGRWPQPYRDEKEDAKRTALNTAFIARVLAMEKGKEAKADKAFAAALSRALDYLAKRIEEIDEPYLIASYALAAMDAGEKKVAEKAVAKLRTLAREEAGTSYWNLESNTPFYGWGLAGRIETTALAVNALKRAGAAEIGKAGERDKAESLTNRGLLFLLRNKDRYGVWLSTQATINVLDALISLNEGEVAMSGATGGAEIVVNGKRVSSVALPPAGQLSNPITVDLSSFLSRGNNRVEIRRSGYAARASAQVVETHYEPWEQGAAARRENFRLRNSSALRLAVNYDKLEAKIGEEVVCNVTAERVGHYGYGMMLAEIGLPPGADVDRESLERAAQESGWRLNHYDVLPDRVIAYLWPQAGGLKFSFKLKPRYGVKAQTAPSALYDYYNPEARVALAPSRFVVK